MGYQFSQRAGCTLCAVALLEVHYCWVATGVVVALYTGILVKDHIPDPPRSYTNRFRSASRNKYPRLTRPSHDIPECRAGSTIQCIYARSSQGPVPLAKATGQPMDYDLQIAWHLVIEIAVVLILWGLAVMNTELPKWNNFAPSNGTSSWQVGQVRRVWRRTYIAYNAANRDSQVLSVFFVVLLFLS
ncbi:hypothetical protein C8R43DRAFT_608563 [Mycena crocata]|nr:hypothetical protein C8R43DRAFT_608563 [Mycena crocata]